MKPKPPTPRKRAKRPERCRRCRRRHFGRTCGGRLLDFEGKVSG